MNLINMNFDNWCRYVWTPRGASGGPAGGGGHHMGLKKNPPPPTYTCYRCGNRGHWIQMCPTNGVSTNTVTSYCCCGPFWENVPKVGKTTIEIRLKVGNNSIFNKYLKPIFS